MINIFFIIIAVTIFIYIVYEIKKGILKPNESFFWFFGSLLSLILAFFPKIFDKISSILGIEYSPSLLFLLCILFLFLISLRSSKKIAVHDEKIMELAQRMAVFSEECNKKK